ncbi:MAG: lipoprotein-releasing ABC transporter permease subunit [Gammaproteobacteria bacterium]|nr:MAG: lipoprotein-releasing ABC transporter permease subunit [Gammaproteobacteria bacterium]
MFRPLPFYLALRNFTSGSRNRLVSFISLLAILGLVLGVALLILVASVMNGFDREMESRILGAVPHLRLLSRSGIDDEPRLRQLIVGQENVTAVMPFTRLEGMLTRSGKTQPVEVMGIEPALSGQFIGRFVPEEMMSALAAQSGGVLLAQALAEKLAAGVGDRVTLLVPTHSEAGVLQQAPQVAAFTVLGTFSTHTTLDQGLMLVNLAEASRLAGSGAKPLGMQVKVADLFRARQTGFQLLGVLPNGFHFSDWLQTHGNLYQAIKMSRNLVSLLVFLVVAIAVFNVISMLMMTVIDKRAEIAILKTQGASRGEIVTTFLAQGFLIGLFGAGVGVLLGVVAAQNITAVAHWLEGLLGRQLLNSEIYPIDYLPSVLSWSDVAVIVAVALSLNFLATLYPAFRAAGTRPAEVLRYE